MTEKQYIFICCMLAVVLFIVVMAVLFSQAKGSTLRERFADFCNEPEFYGGSVELFGNSEQLTDAEEISTNELKCYTIYDIPLSEDLQVYVQEICGNHGIDPKLIYGIMAVESSFNPKATNGNCYGLMQVNDINLVDLFAEIGVANLFAPEQNISAGVCLFDKALRSNNGNVHKALIEYNCGRVGANMLFGNGIVKTAYSRKVLAFAESLELKTKIYQ